MRMIELLRLARNANDRNAMGTWPHRRTVRRHDEIGARHLPPEHGGGEMESAPEFQFRRHRLWRWRRDSEAHLGRAWNLETLFDDVVP